jgi:hypothetical protein
VLGTAIVLIILGGWITSTGGMNGTTNNAADTPYVSVNEPFSRKRERTIPPHGRTPLIGVPWKRHIVVEGAGILVHNVYADGSECAYGEPCADGILRGNYISNVTDGPVTFKYRFEP